MLTGALVFSLIMPKKDVSLAIPEILPSEVTATEEMIPTDTLPKPTALPVPEILPVIVETEPAVETYYIAVSISSNSTSPQNNFVGGTEKVGEIENKNDHVHGFPECCAV